MSRSIGLAYFVEGNCFFFSLKYNALTEEKTTWTWQHQFITYNQRQAFLSIFEAASFSLYLWRSLSHIFNQNMLFFVECISPSLLIGKIGECAYFLLFFADSDWKHTYNEICGLFHPPYATFRKAKPH